MKSKKNAGASIGSIDNMTSGKKTTKTTDPMKHKRSGGMKIITWGCVVIVVIVVILALSGVIGVWGVPAVQD